MSGYLLDTHTWLWVQNNTIQNLSSDFVRDLETHQQQRKAYISPISVLEIAGLVALNQFQLGVSVYQFVADATADDGFILTDLSTKILIESTRLPGDLHRDPADRILIATARELNLILITRDKRLLDYAKQGHLTARKP